MSTLELAPALACPAALHGAHTELLSSPPSQQRPSAPPPVWEFGRQILTYCIRLNICLGEKSEFVVHLEMGTHFFGLLYLQDNLSTEFTRSNTPSSRSDLQVAPLCIHSLC